MDTGYRHGPPLCSVYQSPGEPITTFSYNMDLGSVFLFNLFKFRTVNISGGFTSMTQCALNKTQDIRMLARKVSNNVGCTPKLTRASRNTNYWWRVRITKGPSFNPLVSSFDDLFIPILQIWCYRPNTVRPSAVLSSWSFNFYNAFLVFSNI